MIDKPVGAHEHGRVLCRQPHQISCTADRDSVKGDKRDMGVTTQPEHSVAPAIDLRVTRNSEGWWVRCDLTPAVEGNNRAIYLAPGTYPTGLAYAHGGLGVLSPDSSDPEIHAILDKTNSDRSREAEIEHCRDWIRAYEITCKSAENTVRFAMPGLENRRFDSRNDAYAGALQAFLGHSRHQRIADVFKRSFRSGAFDSSSFSTALIDLFLEVGNKTGERDSNYWHHFELDRNVVTSSDLGWGDWFASGSRSYRRIQPSMNFRINQVSSDELIRF